jgi:lipopolysaccharide transport system permease protein
MHATLFTHRALLWQLMRRDVASKYRGAALGMLWSLLNPLLMLAIYTFVFSVVFQTRWAGGGAAGDATPSQGQFALILFTGLMIHALAAEALLRAPTTITSQVNYVKKVVFPLEILPLVPLGSAVFHYGLSLVVLLGAMVCLTGNVPLTVFWLPVVLLPFVIALAGVVWIIASLGVFLRDIGQVMGMVVSILLFLSPIFFPPEALPVAYRPLLALNPLTVIITQARAVLLWGQMPDFMALAVYGICALLLAFIGYAWFTQTRKGFADVL